MFEYIVNTGWMIIVFQWHSFWFWPPSDATTAAKPNKPIDQSEWIVLDVEFLYPWGNDRECEECIHPWGWRTNS